LSNSEKIVTGKNIACDNFLMTNKSKVWPQIVFVEDKKVNSWNLPEYNKNGIKKKKKRNTQKY
jgi:hypothetical protein